MRSLPTMHYPRQESLSIEVHTNEEEGTVLLHSDQTYIVFDVDQGPNAVQTINIKRALKTGLVAFRFLTNAPTRYLVKPNAGVLADNKPVKIRIELYGNRYNPQHKLVLQGVVIHSKEEAETVWNAKDFAKKTVHEINFALGTTITDVDKVSGFADTSKQSEACVANVLRWSHAKGLDKVHELEGLLKMLQADNERLLHNIEITARLRNVIKTQITQRRDMTADKLMKVVELEKEQEKLETQIKDVEDEIQQIHERFRVKILDNAE